MISLDHELLRCFVAIAETGSFTAAGEKLGLTQPGVSVRVKKLEDRLQKALLIRSKRAVSLTPDGEVLLDYAQRMMTLNREIIHYFNAPEMSGKLRVGIADYVAHNSLQPLLRHFRQCYPKVTLEVQIGLGIDLVPRFEEGKLDLVISGISETTLVAQVLFEEQLVWCAATDWHQDSAEAAVELLSLPAPCSHRAAGIQALTAEDRPWTQLYTSTNIASVQAAVLAGLGVAVLPQSVVDERFKVLGPQDGFPPLPQNKIGALVLDPQNPLAQVFLDFYMESHG